jgi:hypothetical protein
MQRLKRVSAIDIEICPRCGDQLRVIAYSEAPWLIRRIFGHVQQREEFACAPAGAPPGHQAEALNLI